MARRSIAKTAVEGGRVAVCRELEREEDKYNRRVWKKFCSDSIRDDEVEEPATEALIGGFDRYRAGREFADKLNPVKRWLEKQVGRPWDKVRSEVVAQFDNRSLAGRHILEHVDGYVDLPWDQWNVSSGSVDENGVLKQHKIANWKHRWRSMYVDVYGILRVEK